MSDASNSAIKSMIGETFLSLANALETGQFGKKVRIGITNRGLFVHKEMIKAE